MTIKERENIIKALECCGVSSELRVCTADCPYFSIPLEDVDNCNDVLARDALVLIKELTEENKDLEADYDRVYEQAEADIRGNMADGGMSCHWCIAGHTADAVNRFANYLKEHSFNCDPGNGHSFDAIDIDELDGYVKEFLEEHYV